MLFSSNMERFFNSKTSESNFILNEVIIDEASQIPAYLTYALLHTYTTIRKMVVVGDPMQLLPYGSAPGRQITCPPFMPLDTIRCFWIYNSGCLGLSRRFSQKDPMTGGSKLL